MKKNEIKQVDKLISSLLDNPETTHGLNRTLRNLRKELELYKSHKSGLKKWNDTLQKATSEKIQIGGGKHTKEGYLNIDIVPPADIVCDVREGIPLPDESASLIFNEHFIEHIDYPTSVKKVTKECYRILKPQGKLIIGVPDGELAIKKYIKRDKVFFNRMLSTWYRDRNCLEYFSTYIDLVNYIFRDQDDDDTFTPHLWTYDLEKLESLLKEAGFSKARKWKFDPRIAREKRKWGSVYVEGVK